MYYNYRYYNPAQGKWLSRDPIEERGGKNLYGFSRNNGINYIDRLGLDVYLHATNDIFTIALAKDQIFNDKTMAQLEKLAKEKKSKGESYGLLEEGDDPVMPLSINNIFGSTGTVNIIAHGYTGNIGGNVIVSQNNAIYTQDIDNNYQSHSITSLYSYSCNFAKNNQAMQWSKLLGIPVYGASGVCWSFGNPKILDTFLNW